MKLWLALRERMARYSAALLAAGLGAALRVVHTSWRVQTEGLEQLDARLAAGERVLVSFWHGCYFPLYALLQGRRACALTNDSFRGRVIAALCRRFGYACRRLCGHGHAALLQAAREALEQGQVCGIAADGPLGPARRVKRGLVALASELRCAVVPLAVCSRPKWRSRRRWDAREFPLPFAEVRMIAGSPLLVPPELAPSELGAWAERLAERLNALEIECLTALAGRGERPAPETGRAVPRRRAWARALLSRPSWRSSRAAGRRCGE